VKVTNIKSYDFPGYSQNFNSGNQVSNFRLSSTTFVARKNTNEKPGQRSGVWHQCGVLDSQCVTNLVLTVREDDITQSRANSWPLAYFKSVTLLNPKKAELSRSRSTSLLHHGLVTSNNVIRAEPGLITTAEHDSLLEQTSNTLVLSVEPSSRGNVAAASQFNFFP